jgi:hypothetical protein
MKEHAVQVDEVLLRYRRLGLHAAIYLRAKSADVIPKSLPSAAVLAAERIAGRAQLVINLAGVPIWPSTEVDW